jgi:HEPN domain-containing protein
VDVLVLVRDERVAEDGDLWSKVEARAEKHTSGIPVELVVHTVKDVNRKLERGWYFFADVYKEGIMLYDSYRTQLAEPKEMSLAQRRDFALLCFEEGLKKANGFYRHFEFGLEESTNDLAAFQLHQSTEAYYKTMLMVFTAYRPKQHNIEKLGNRCRNLHEDMGGIFSMDTPEDKVRFKLLKAAYVDARYSMKYSITREDLDILATHVRALRARTERICRAHIAALTAAAAREATD